MPNNRKAVDIKRHCYTLDLLSHNCYLTSSLQLPDPYGKAGGACTSAMLKVLYADKKAPDTDLTFQEVLLQMRDVLKKGGYSQIPQLTSSRPLDIKQKFDIVPSDATGTRRAVIIGINYVGQQGQLSGCHNDAINMMEYIKDVHGFQEENIAVLLDDGEHTSPTRENILEAYKNLVAQSKAGDVAFCHYSGMLKDVLCHMQCCCFL